MYTLRFLWLCVMPSLFLLLVAVCPARAGTTGKLSGFVIDDQGAPLPLVTVRVEGQRIGAVTTESGEYFVIGVLAGRYTIRASRIGYATFVAQDVAILPDFTTTLDITMPAAAIEMAPVEVTADRPLLQRDATGTTRFIGHEDLLALPTRGYRDAAALQSGIVNYRRPPTGFAVAFESAAQNQPRLVTRGGRPNETAYFVDGFSQQDPLTGSSLTAISNNAIEEVVVLTGGFAPEYGGVMSGAVNVITREGAKKYFGSIEMVTDKLAGDWIGAPRTDYNVYDISLGGPVLPGRDDLTFYVSSERKWERDRSPSFLSSVYRRQLATGADYGSAATGDPILSGRVSNDDVKPNNSSSVYALQGKLTWRLNDQMTMRAGGLGSQDDWREYVHAFLFNPDYMPRHRDRTETYFATLNHRLGGGTYYDVGLNYFGSQSKTGDMVRFDNLKGYADLYRPAALPNLDLDVPYFYLTDVPVNNQLGVGTAYSQHDSRYVGIQSSISSQLGAHHQLKAGVEFQRHTLRMIAILQPVTFGGPNPDYSDIDGYGYEVVIDRFGSGPDSGRVRDVRLENVDDGRDGAKHPKVFSVYAQDKFEREGLIVNGGVRLDYFDVDTPALANESSPLGDPSDPGNLPDSLEAQDLRANKVYTRVSPRLGVAFPIDERTLLRFNYGQFYQQTNLRDLYVSYRYLQYLLRVHPYVMPIGNPNLRPERTTAYEVGMARALTDRIRLDITAYRKNVQDLVEVVNVSTTSFPVPLYRNRDFATIKGVDFGLKVRPLHHVGGNLSYSLMSAEGTGSSSTTQFRIAWLGGTIPTMTTPLDFDQRHKISLGIDWSLGSGEGPRWGERFRPLENTSLSLLLNAASGTPYTPTIIFDEVSQSVTSPRPLAPVNSRYSPWTASVDLKLTRTIPVSGARLDAYVWVLNLFNAKNAINVYRSTGSATSTNWLSTPEGGLFMENTATRGIDGAGLYELAQNNPTLYANPRLVRFGLRWSF